MSTPFAERTSVAVSGRYAYFTTTDGSDVTILDISNPAKPVTVVTASVTDFYSDITISGRYAYTLGATYMYTIDISNPLLPVRAATTTIAGGDSSGSSAGRIHVSGRYAYLTRDQSNVMLVVDIASSTNPIVIATTTVSGINNLAVLGKVLVTANKATLQTFSIPGLETSSLLAHSLEAGTLSVQTNATVANNLTVGGGLNVGQGGILSTGSLGISSTNTTSTITFAVSSTKGIFSDYVLVNNKKVCLADGTNCQASVGGGGSDDWMHDVAGDFTRPNTSTTDILLGGATEASSPFWFRIDASSSRFYVGGNGSSTNMVIGGPSSTITNTDFQLDGNDLFVAGNIGSASSVYTNGAFIAGSGTTLYGDGYITKTNGSLTVTSSQHVLFLPSSNVGIGTSTPSEKLTVVGGVQNTMVQGQALTQLGSVNLPSGSSTAVAIQGRYAYVTNIGNDTLATYDISDPLFPSFRGSVSFQG